MFLSNLLFLKIVRSFILYYVYDHKMHYVHLCSILCILIQASVSIDEGNESGRVEILCLGA